MKYNDAKFIEKATYDEVILKNLRVMDFTSIALAKENNLVVKVLSLTKENGIKNAIVGKSEGTTISA
jgi:uridylate kinase